MGNAHLEGTSFYTRMEYLKPYLSIPDQADRLLRRGLLADRGELEERLTDVSYYRLSAYWYPFREISSGGLTPSDYFIHGISLELIWSHYIFDRQLRFLLMDAIERIEVSIRTRLVYLSTQLFGAFGYIGPHIFCDLNQHEEWIKKVRNCVSRAKKMSPCLKHFYLKYGDKHSDPPMWISAEVMDFGTMSSLFSHTTVNIRNQTVAGLSISAAVLETWLRCLNAVRNSCAHHEYIWCRTWVNKPAIPRHHSLWKSSISDLPSSATFHRDGTGTVLMMCRELLRMMAPTSEWHQRVERLFEAFSDKGIDFNKMGLPLDWQNHPLWK